MAEAQNTKQGPLGDKVIVITGASDGIGAAAAEMLSRAGNTVVIVGRSADKTKAVAERIGAEWFTADFARFADVRRLAYQLLERYSRIDVLANNAGAVIGRRTETADGHETTLQVNHLSPFLLTALLRDRLVADGATVIQTSSAANSLFSRFDIDDLDGRRRYSGNAAYGNAKLANILFTRELQRRFGSEDGTSLPEAAPGESVPGVNAAAFHPGVVRTNFSAESSSALKVMYGKLFGRFLLSAAEGADTMVWLATSTPRTEWAPGEYYYKRSLQRANPLAYDADLAAKLWSISAEWVGVDE